MSKDQRIEPSMGATYGNDGHYAVYEYDTYPRHSVLSGRTQRTYLNGGYDTAASAQADYPDAVIVDGTSYVEDLMLDLPCDDDPDYSDVDVYDPREEY